MKRKNKVPALMQPMGIQPWTQVINTMDLHMTTRSDVLEVVVKKLKGRKIYHFKTNQISLGQFGNNIEMALQNRDKIDFFCSRLHICCESQARENLSLNNKLNETKEKLNDVKNKIQRYMDEIKKSEGKLPVKLGQLKAELEDGKEEPGENKAPVPH